jgi:hypothetical protein
MLSIYGQEERGCRRKLEVEVGCDVIFIRSYYMGYVVDMGRDKKLIENFIRKTTRQILPLVRPRSRWDGHLQINFRRIRHEVQN